MTADIVTLTNDVDTTVTQSDTTTTENIVTTSTSSAVISTNTTENEVTLEANGRHDPCVVPRAVPIVEAMSALVILDYILINNTYQK